MSEPLTSNNFYLNYYKLVYYYFFEDLRLHRYLVDCTRWWASDAASVPAKTAPYVEELQASHLHCRSNRRQLHSNEEGFKDVPLPPSYRRRG